ncbi:MAG: hypothetical protein LBC75_02765 [Fibromonadaceae bacterium]|jgi:hypothetical protein|nr:hypothetical protein [Fibromonadaceae bacterium]
MYFGEVIGRITNYVKTAQLEQKWQQKKFEMSGDKSKETGGVNDWMKAKRIGDIKNKMKSGKRLSFEEKEFLRINAPDLYEKAMKIEKERDEFRRALEKCKTKEEAMRLQTSKALELQTEAQAMSCKFKDGQERDESEFIAMRMMAIFDEYADFTKSKEYSEMPNEYEENENVMEYNVKDEENENAENDEDVENNGEVTNNEKNKKSRKSKFRKINAPSNERIILESYKLNTMKILNSPYGKPMRSTPASPAIKAPFASPANKP